MAIVRDFKLEPFTSAIQAIPPVTIETSSHGKAGATQLLQVQHHIRNIQCRSAPSFVLYEFISHDWPARMTRHPGNSGNQRPACHFLIQVRCAVHGINYALRD